MSSDPNLLRDDKQTLPDIRVLKLDLPAGSMQAKFATSGGMTGTGRLGSALAMRLRRERPEASHA